MSARTRTPADASLGLGSTIELNGTLRAAGSFSSVRGFSPASFGTIDTAGFDLAFSGANASGFTKSGFGTLTLSSPVAGTTTVTAGVLVLTHPSSGTVKLQGGTLQVAGVLTELDGPAVPGAAVLDIGGPAASSLTTGTFGQSSTGSLHVMFGIGAAGSDSWLTGGSLPINAGALQFEFQNLGGVTTGVDYPLISFITATPSVNTFALSPESAAAGWAGTFKVTAGINGQPGLVTVRFTSVPVPEPSGMVLALVGGTLLASAQRCVIKRRRRCISQRAAGSGRA